MKRKPDIGYCHKRQAFVIGEKPITFEKAKEHWEMLTANWSMGALREMAQRTK